MKKVHEANYETYPFTSNQVVLETREGGEYHFTYTIGLDSSLNIDEDLVKSSQRTFLNDENTSFKSIYEARVQMGKCLKYEKERLIKFMSKKQYGIDK